MLMSKFKQGDVCIFVPCDHGCQREASGICVIQALIEHSATITWISTNLDQKTVHVPLDHLKKIGRIDE